MKKLLTLLFALYFLSSPSVFADDISDFQIEGISIGDSLLDYMTEEEIFKGIEETKNHYLNLNEPNKYAEVYLFEDFPTYDDISVFIKNNSTNQYVGNKNEKYTILFIRGMMHYNEDFDSCMAKRNEIVKIFSGMFPNAKKRDEIFKHSADSSGRSIIDVVYFAFDSGGGAVVHCINFEENFRIKNKQNEGLNVAIQSTEFISWFRDR